MKRLLLAALTLAFVAAAHAATGKLHVVTSFFPIYCWTAEVAGDAATVENLLPARAEPHEYAFTPGDARKLARADLVVVNGLRLEGWLPKFLRTSPEARRKIVTATIGLEEQLLYGEHHHHHGHEAGGHEEHGHEQPNEHTWLDPLLAAHSVSNILAALQQADPAQAAIYARNAKSYVARLHELDASIRAKLASVTNRALVTYHDAFPYFAQRYGLEIAGVVEQIPEVNPTPKYLSRLGRMMRARGIGVIGVPPGGESRLARRIAADLRVKLLELDTLETGPLVPAAYEANMLKNADALATCLK